MNLNSIYNEAIDQGIDPDLWIKTTENLNQNGAHIMDAAKKATKALQNAKTRTIQLRSPQRAQRVAEAIREQFGLAATVTGSTVKYTGPLIRARFEKI